MSKIKSNNAVNPVKRFLKDMYIEEGLYASKTANRVSSMLDDSKDSFEQYRKLLGATKENSAIDKVMKASKSSKELSKEAVKNLDNNLSTLKSISENKKYVSNPNAESAVYRTAMATNGTKIKDRKLKKLYEDELARTTGKVRRGAKVDTTFSYLDPTKMNAPQMIARYGATTVGAVGVGNMISSIGNGDEY